MSISEDFDERCKIHIEDKFRITLKSIKEHFKKHFDST